MSKQYTHLASFLQSWFHQDFDLYGGALEEVVAAYKKSARSPDVAAVREDIDNFLANNDAEWFDELFDLDINPLAFACSVDDFLISIERALAANNDGN